MEEKVAEGLYWGHLNKNRGLEDMIAAEDNTKMYLKEKEPG